MPTTDVSHTHEQITVESQFYVLGDDSKCSEVWRGEMGENN